MNQRGLAICTRYGYPPNSLSLCGPEKQSFLAYYATTQKNDKGTVEILSQFSTLYPYLQLIAVSNNIRDPFDPRVVNAYWLGNSLLHAISERAFERHLLEDLELKRKIPKNRLSPILSKLDHHLLPHHAFHVLNIYHRTGNFDNDHTVPTMDACIIHWGIVTKKLATSLVVKTEPLILQNGKLLFGDTMLREISAVSASDLLFQQCSVGDTITYHWGLLCTKITKGEVKNLRFYTNKAMSLANTTLS